MMFFAPPVTKLQVPLAFMAPGSSSNTIEYPAHKTWTWYLETGAAAAADADADAAGADAAEANAAEGEADAPLIFYRVKRLRQIQI